MLNPPPPPYPGYARPPSVFVCPQCTMLVQIVNAHVYVPAADGVVQLLAQPLQVAMLMHMRVGCVNA